MENPALELVNAENRELAFSICPLGEFNKFGDITRRSCYTIVWIREGGGNYKSDFSMHRFSANDMLFFAPYQPFVILPRGKMTTQVLTFHPEFFCIEKHDKEIACNGVLFNNIYMPPSISIPSSSTSSFSQMIESMEQEMLLQGIAQKDFLISYLKIFLILASRLKVLQTGLTGNSKPKNIDSHIVSQFRQLIESMYRQWHRPSDYTKSLGLAPKSLSKLVKLHLHKTASQVIQERITIEAKRELYLTDKSIKVIAFELGFNDEYYFSRFFKKLAKISPQGYRRKVGFNQLEVSNTSTIFCPL